jgi:hypothetical protein
MPSEKNDLRVRAGDCAVTMVAKRITEQERNGSLVGTVPQKASS